MSQQDVALLAQPQGGSQFRPPRAPEGKKKSVAHLFRYWAGGYQAGAPNADCTPTLNPPHPAHLMSKLVAREAEHDQAPGPEALLQLVHLGVVPDRGASERSHILDEQHLAPQGAQTQRLPAGQRAR